MLRGLQIKRWKKTPVVAPGPQPESCRCILHPSCKWYEVGLKGGSLQHCETRRCISTVPDVEIEDQIMHPAEPHWRDGWVGEDWQENKCVLEKCFGCTVYIKILTARLFSHSWILTPFQIRWTTLPGKGSANVTSALTLKALPNCNRRNHLLGNHLYNC